MTQSKSDDVYSEWTTGSSVLVPEGAHDTDQGHQWLDSAFVLTVVFVAGFTNLAVEVIGGRLVSGVYGATNHVWACVIVATLGGLSVGYFIGGSLGSRPKQFHVPAILLAAALTILALRDVINTAAGSFHTYSITSILATACLGLIAPSILLGTIPPLSVSLLRRRDNYRVPISVGIIYGVGTIGGILGGILTVLLGIPHIGISLCLKSLSTVLALLALLTARRRWAVLAVVPLAVYTAWHVDPDLPRGLLARIEGEYQTISVYESDSGESVLFMLGHASESQYHKPSQTALSPYARDVMTIVDKHAPENVLIIGGAGNALALELESKGITVESIEIDPVVVKVSEQYFGKSEGTVHIGDGRAAIKWGELQQKDMIIVDAFFAPGQLPPHMVTREYFRELGQLLRDHGVLLVNTATVPGDHFGGLAGAFYSTLESEFRSVRVVPVSDGDLHSRAYQNTLFVATIDSQVNSGFECHGWFGPIATDDHNPIETLMLEAQSTHLTHVDTDDMARAFLAHLP